MTTTKFLLPVLLAIGTFVATLPDTAGASPHPGRFQNPNNHYRPGHRARPNNVPELGIGAAAAALGLLGGGLMIMTGRRRPKRD